MDITLENREPQAIARAYRRFDFPIPATVFTADEGTIDFGGGKSADYVLGIQTGPLHRWIHIRNLSWDLAANQKVTGTMSTGTPGSPIPLFTALTGTGSGIDEIGGPSSAGAKPIIRVSYTDSTPDIDITLEFWEQTNTSDFMHEWIARGRHVATGILTEWSFMFWPDANPNPTGGLNQVECGIINMRSDLTQDLGRIGNIESVSAIMPTGWQGHFWWDEFYTRNAVSSTTNIRLWDNQQGSNHYWAECAGTPGTLMTMLPDVANAAEIADVVNKSKIGFACHGMASRSDWEGKFGPLPKFVTDFTPKVFLRNNINCPDTAAFITQRWAAYLSDLNLWKSRSLPDDQRRVTRLGAPSKMFKTGDHPGIAKTKSFAPFCVEDGYPGAISEFVWDMLPYFRRPIWFRHRGPGDGGTDGEPVEFIDYPHPDRLLDTDSGFLLLNEQALWPAVYGSPPLNAFPLSQAEMYNARYSYEKQNGDDYQGGRMSHLLTHEQFNCYALTGRRIFRTMNEQFLRGMLFEWHTGDYNLKSQQQGYGGTFAARAGRAWGTYAFLLHSTTDATLIAAVKDRIAKRMTKTPAAGHNSEYEELWRRVTQTFPFKINAFTTSEATHLWHQHKVWDAWFGALFFPGLYSMYLETTDANLLEAIRELGKTWLEDAFWYGARPQVSVDPTWHLVKYMVIPGAAGNPGTDGDRPYLSHPTEGNWYLRETTNGKYVEDTQEARVEYSEGIDHTWWLGALVVLEKVMTDWSQPLLASRARTIHDHLIESGPDYTAERGHLCRMEDHQVNVDGPPIRQPQPIVFKTEPSFSIISGGDTKLTILGKPGGKPSSLRLSFRIGRRGSRRNR
tara:strand:- start:11181 stop:13715 length:2535 start_codon:yes stop_codon:yes gene_type:complete